MSALREISTDSFAAPAATSPGPAPMLDWIKIAKLRVDDAYQRGVGERGRRTIRNIIAGFDWSKFAPVVVAPIEGGLFAVIDGQHRSTAAAVCGIEAVPCAIVQADRAQQAKAFAAINGQVTAITPLQMHHARLAAGDPTALKLKEICAASEVVIMRYPKAADEMKKGETLAVGKLMRLAAEVDRDLLIRALQCVTQTGEGNPSLLRAPIIQAFVDVLKWHPNWSAAAGSLFDAVDSFDMLTEWEEAVARVSMGGTTRSRFTARLELHLKKKMPATAEAA